MVRFKKFVQKKNEGKITYGDGIIESIISHALKDISHAELYSLNSKDKPSKKCVKVNFEKDGVHIEIQVKIHFSQSINDMAFKIQETVRHNIENMTDYHVSSVNVIVKGVITNDVVIEKPVENSDINDATLSAGENKEDLVANENGEEENKWEV